MDRRRDILSLGCGAAFAVLVAGCSASGSTPDTTRPASDGGTGESGPCSEGSTRCDAHTLQRCTAGAWVDSEDCLASNRLCNPALGCVVCSPPEASCEGTALLVCDSNGQGFSLLRDCAEEPGSVCDASARDCINPCDKAEDERSTIGCEYWAVDLDNWFGTDMLNPDATAQQFSLVVTNPNTIPVQVNVEVNEALPGQPLQLVPVSSATVPPSELVRIDLPQREVDGSVLNRNDGTGSALTSRAFRVTSNGPIVAYQFNPIAQTHTNDASILIPTSALDTIYWVMAYQGIGMAANPLLPSSTNYAFLTIVGTAPDTVVNVTLSAGVSPGGPIPTWTPPGATVTATLGPFDVWNIQASCPPNTPLMECISQGATDFTGTRVTATKPVAVFAGAECVNVIPATCTGSENCCCDHLEDQLFPSTSLGTHFVAAHSPSRGGTEADVWRILADASGTVVTTNLPAPFAQMTLQAGQFVEIPATSSFVVSATRPLLVGQFLASQQCTPNVTGDPAFTTFPPVEQHRQDYTFLVPTTFDQDYAAIVRAQGTLVSIDGLDVPTEFPSCTTSVAGDLEGKSYEVLHCSLQDGTHHVQADQPVGLVVYGYGPAGSYAYPGGSNVRRINMPR